MSVRTYNPSVRVGNWNEDIQLEEDMLKDFLERRQRGELLIQKASGMMSTSTSKCELSTSRDGNVHFGDVVLMMNPACKDGSRKDTSLSVNMAENGQCGVTASSCNEATSRTAFVVSSLDGSQPGDVLRYEQPFYLRTNSDQPLFLSSDRATFTKAAKKSRHNEVSLVAQPSHLTEWKIVAFDPQYRLELEHTPVPANMKVVPVHVKTNQALCLEAAHTHRTSFGREFEVSSFTDLDSHKAEKDDNHWMMVENVPGDRVMPVQAPV